MSACRSDRAARLAVQLQGNPKPVLRIREEDEYDWETSAPEFLRNPFPGSSHNRFRQSYSYSSSSSSSFSAAAWQGETLGEAELQQLIGAYRMRSFASGEWLLSSVEAKQGRFAYMRGAGKAGTLRLHAWGRQSGDASLTRAGRFWLPRHAGCLEAKN